MTGPITMYLTVVCIVHSDIFINFSPPYVPSTLSTLILETPKCHCVAVGCFFGTRRWNITMTSHITSLTVVYSIVYLGVDQRKHQSSASLAFVRGIHRGGWANSPHKWPVTRKMFPFDDVIMFSGREDGKFAVVILNAFASCCAHSNSTEIYP